jgi:hypothetical protein
MTEAVIECIYAVPGSALKIGDKFFDLSVDLSSGFSQECPPISFYRVILREKAFLRDFSFDRGQPCKVGELIALFSTEPDEATDVPPQRGIRTATAGIMHHAGIWTGNAP